MGILFLVLSIIIILMATYAFCNIAKKADEAHDVAFEKWSLEHPGERNEWSDY